MMKFGICNETFGDWPLERALAYARELGYTGWEVAPFMLTDDLHSFGSEQRLAYREQVESAGFQIIGLHWLLAKTNGLHLTTVDQEMRARTTDYLCDLARLCRDLGGKVWFGVAATTQCSRWANHGIRDGKRCVGDPASGACSGRD